MAATSAKTQSARENRRRSLRKRVSAEGREAVARVPGGTLCGNRRRPMGRTSLKRIRRRRPPHRASADAVAPLCRPPRLLGPPPPAKSSAGGRKAPPRATDATRTAPTIKPAGSKKQMSDRHVKPLLNDGIATPSFDGLNHDVFLPPIYRPF